MRFASRDDLNPNQDGEEAAKIQAGNFAAKDIVEPQDGDTVNEEMPKPQNSGTANERPNDKMAAVPPMYPRLCPVCLTHPKWPIDRPLLTRRLLRNIVAIGGATYALVEPHRKQ